MNLRGMALFVALFLLIGPSLVSAAPPPTLEDEILALARIPSVVGRESRAAEFVRSRLGDLPVEQDALGNLVLTLGSGAPRQLFAAPLDEPGFVVSRIEDDGYLRITPVPFTPRGTLAAQYLEGHKITVLTKKGLVHGAVTVPSAHLTAFAKGDGDDWPPFAWQDAFVDVGAESAGEVGEMGIRLLDPLVLEKNPTRFTEGLIAAPSIQGKAAAMALVSAARRLAPSKASGTVVLTWTVLGLLNGKGLEAVVQRHGPFDDALVFSRNFGFEAEVNQAGRGQTTPVPLPNPGSGVLTDQPAGEGPPGTLWAPHLARFPFPITGSPKWEDARLTYLGLPVRYQDSPVELVDMSDVRRLAGLWVRLGGGGSGSPPRPLPSSLPFAAESSDLPHADLADKLSSLIARYGVSGAEQPVRERIKELLPSWAEPVTDEAGNLTVTVGEGDEHLAFVAHMDETGYRVREIRPDGRLVLEPRGGMLTWVWEAQAALVHVEGGPLAAVFEPRAGAHRATTRALPGPLTVYLGVESKKDAVALGVEAGVTTVTMPKRMARIGQHRALARGFDDRAGSLALVLAASRIDPAALRRRVTLAWSVEEEIGMTGAMALADRFRDVDMVYPVDTFVSSDAPLEHRGNAYCPLGGGAVVRVLESINFAPLDQVDAVLGLAQERAIAVQVGLTSGGTDGQPFLVHGIPSLPLSWPGRYSHSPIEVLDLRDLEALIDLVTAIAIR